MQKKHILIILFFLSMGISAQTKLLVPAEIYIGTSHGATGSMVLFNPNVKQNFLFGYNGGVVFRYINEKHKALQIELNFTQNGWKEAKNVYARQLNYLELPFMSHFYYGDRTRAFLNIGPQVSFLLSESVLNNKLPDSEAENHTAKISNRINYGFCLGVGCQFTIKKQMFQFETRANMSLNSIFPSARKDYFRNSNNAYLAVNMGWLIRVR